MHDRHGKPLAVGDKVVIEGTVTTRDDNAPICNLTVTTDVPMEGTAFSVTLSAKQVTKISDGTAADAAQIELVGDGEE